MRSRSIEFDEITLVILEKLDIIYCFFEMTNSVFEANGRLSYSVVVF